MAWLFRDFCTFILRYEPLRHRHHRSSFWIVEHHRSSFWIVEHHRSSFWIVEHHWSSFCFFENQWSSFWIVEGISIVIIWSSSDVAVPVSFVNALFFFAILCYRLLCWYFSGVSCWCFECSFCALLPSFALIVVNSSFLSFDYILLLLFVKCKFISIWSHILLASPILFSNVFGMSLFGSFLFGNPLFASCYFSSFPFGSLLFGRFCFPSIFVKCLFFS